MMATVMPKLRNSGRHGGALKLHRRATFGEVSKEPLQSQIPVISPVPVTGTALAVSNLISGVAADSARGTRWGGARNHADRASEDLTAAQVDNLLAAARQASNIGLPFTRMISIHWQAAGVPLAGMVKATGRFLDLMSKALARHGSETAWLWTHENVPGSGHDKGGHVHLLAHVPAALVPVVTALQRGWLRRITRQPYRARVIRSKPIGGRLGLEAGNTDLHAVNLEAALAYVVKGAGPEAAAQFNLERLEPGGRVIGKRCGTSQNIGAKARSAKD